MTGFIHTSFNYALGNAIRKVQNGGTGHRDWTLNGTHQLPVYPNDPNFNKRKNKYHKGNTDNLLDANKETNQKVKEEKMNTINNQLGATITVY